MIVFFIINNLEWTFILRRWECIIYLLELHQSILKTLYWLSIFHEFTQLHNSNTISIFQKNSSPNFWCWLILKALDVFWIRSNDNSNSASNWTHVMEAVLFTIEHNRKHHMSPNLSSWGLVSFLVPWYVWIHSISYFLDFKNYRRHL